jgi:hypothetical protein
MGAYLCVSIDCECDKGQGWRLKKPLSFESVTGGIADRLQPLFRAYGAKPTYLLSPEVLRDPASVDCLRHLEGSAEFGAHLHGEFVEPDAFEPDETTAFQCNYPPKVERAKLEGLTDLFHAAFGRRPLSFRAGRFGIGSHSLTFLAELGYTVDSSVSPLKDWSRQGAPAASFRSAPTQPYWPVMAMPDVAANVPGPLLEVPVTILPSKFARLPLIGARFEPRWLRPTHGSAESLVAVARDELARTKEGPVVLNCMFHNVEIMPGLSPYAKNEDEAGGILERLAALLAFARSEGIAVVGLADIPAVFARAPRVPQPALGPVL